MESILVIDGYDMIDWSDMMMMMNIVINTDGWYKLSQVIVNYSFN